MCINTKEKANDFQDPFTVLLQDCFRTALQDRKSFRIQYQYTGSGYRTGIQYRMHVNAT